MSEKLPTKYSFANGSLKFETWIHLNNLINWFSFFKTSDKYFYKLLFVTSNLYKISTIIFFEGGIRGIHARPKYYKFLIKFFQKIEKLCPFYSQMSVFHHFRGSAFWNPPRRRILVPSLKSDFSKRYVWACFFLHSGSSELKSCIWNWSVP